VLDIKKFSLMILQWSGKVMNQKKVTSAPVNGSMLKIDMNKIMLL